MDTLKDDKRGWEKKWMSGLFNAYPSQQFYFIKDLLQKEYQKGAKEARCHYYERVKREVLATQNQLIIKKIDPAVNSWISTDDEGNEYMNNEDIKNLKKHLKEVIEQIQNN